jgi:RHS repeat-associated protein
VYDEIGNLIEDKAEQITNIKWSVYGKILEISRNATPKVNVTNIKYTYDALGNRISKEYDLNGTKQYFWYVRDAQGNLLGTYKAETETVVPLASLDVNLVERHIYGSSRLGMYALTQGVDGGPADMQYYTTNTFTRGRRQYELSNHLGNVLITLSDRKFGVSSGGSLIDYYEPDMLSGNDYYPFGMLSRVATSYTGTHYRFGFNGEEHLSEVKGWQNQVDYGMRVYDPRIGKFLSVDPLANKFAYWSPYHFSGNNPIRFIDPDGAEIMPPFFKQWAVDVVLTITTKPNSAKAKVYGAALGIAGAVESAAEGTINLFRHPIETGKGLWRMLTQSHYQNAADYAMAMAEKYGDLPEPVAEIAVMFHALTDLFGLLAPIKKSFTSPKVPIAETSVSTAVETFASKVKTGANEAFFWSGKTEGVGGATRAFEIAKNQGGTTLEGLIESKGIKMPEWDINNPQSVKAWEAISSEYASQVSGKVRAVIGQELRPGNIWENVELPILKANKNVTEIITIDPKTLKETTIFKR